VISQVDRKLHGSWLRMMCTDYAWLDRNNTAVDVSAGKAGALVSYHEEYKTCQYTLV
jgi:hypothetical protein